MKHKVYLSLGSNLGDRKKNLADALGEIGACKSTAIGAVSNVYETDPVGYTDQGQFLNIAAFVETDLEPLNFLKEMQRIEILLKRTREIHWGPRTIDIDLLLYEDLTLTLPELTVPHPRMFERAFVLFPLREVYPSGRICGRDFDEWIEQCGGKEGVRFHCTLDREG